MLYIQKWPGIWARGPSHRSIGQSIFIEKQHNTLQKRLTDNHEVHWRKGLMASKKPLTLKLTISRTQPALRARTFLCYAFNTSKASFHQNVVQRVINHLAMWVLETLP